MFRVGDKVRVADHPQWKTNTMCGFIGTIISIDTTISVSDPDGNEWICPPERVVLLNQEDIVKRLVGNIQNIILSNSNGDSDLELKVFSEWLKNINPKKKTASPEAGLVQLEAVTNRPDQHNGVYGFDGHISR